MIGKIKRLPLRQVWKHEALDFTKWLHENIDVLNEVIDLDLSQVEREQNAGDFSVDLVAEDQSGGGLVVIENQLDKSDHNHLGKLITYLTSLEAKAAIWIVAQPRSEHVRAISWLNESSSESFYLLKVEAIQIDESNPAPLLTRIVGPSESDQEANKAKKETVERFRQRNMFWTALLKKANTRTSLHSGVSAGISGHIGTGAGKVGLGFRYGVRQHDAQVELYIDRGKESETENKKIFDALAERQEDIEAAFGEPLEWERLDAKRACRIKKNIDLGGWRDEDKWPEVHDAMIDAMIRFEKALKNHVAGLKI